MHSGKNGVIISIQIMNKRYCPATDRAQLRSQIQRLLTKYKQITKSHEDVEKAGPERQKEIFQVINCIGMKYAKDGYLQQAEQWLKRAESIAKLFPKLQIILHSNFACIYKKKPDFEQALQHLYQAEKITQALRVMHPENFHFDSLLIDCWLNLSALLSSQGKHEDALCTVRDALVLINFRKASQSQKCNQQYLIGKYNQAVQLEYLGRTSQAYACLEQAKKFMNNHKIYGHFLEKPFSHLHQQLRKKILSKGFKNHRTLSVQSPHKIGVSYNQLASSTKSILKTDGQQTVVTGYKTERSLIKENTYCSQRQKQIAKKMGTTPDQNRQRKTIVKISLRPVTTRRIMQEIKNQ